ncbi:MAG TPA: glutathione S-transferase family protein [Solirubrobacteraceae bacterium]|nr:glutathione S-transferase family protein [Solirubrobacteraceae bacterium]
MARPDCKLITIPISHFCEKARWALDRAGIEFEERAHLQVLHWIPARLAGGGTTVPVLVCGKTVLKESADILAWADAHAPADLRLYPDDPEQAAAVGALERDFDERLGPQGRLWLYDNLRGKRALVRKYAATGVPTWQRLGLPIAYGPVAKILDRHFKITPESAAQAIADVRDTFDEVAERLADGRPYLMGDRFSAADLTFSALSAPVLSPPGYGVPLPEPDELPPAMGAVTRELREHTAGRHALRMFREERR